MAKHLHRDLELLKREILSMGSLVEDALRASLEAFLDGAKDLASTVIEGEHEIDQKEIEVEEECLKVLALHQPVAQDLRFIITVMKVNNDLERIGDMAKNIAKRAWDLARAERGDIPPELRLMIERVKSMVSRSLDALVKLDPAIARSVCEDDDAVDAMHRRMFGSLEERMMSEPASIPAAVRLLSVSRYLERVADLATNIAEDVVFSVEGSVIRHGGLDARPPTIRIVSD